MTTAVASPPSFQAIPRLGWNSNAPSGGLNSMSSDDVSRMFMPQRKTVQRTNSSSSISSTSSSSSTSTTITSPSNAGASTSGESGAFTAKKKARGGFWPATKSEPTTNGVGGGRVQASGSPACSAPGISPVLASPSPASSQSNGVRPIANQGGNEPTAVLALLPLNGTFERKQISVPFFPDVLRIGRQTNAKTVPTPSNGFFDSKVLSRQHAEVWAERNGKIWIRDVKSSNGTFVNGHRLSPENRDSEPHELHQHDTLELGIDIVSEDQKVIVHHKVSAKVEYVGIPGTSNNVLDLNFGDLDPTHTNSLSPLSQPMVTSRGRAGASMANGRITAASSVAGSQMNSLAQQRQINYWSTPLNVEHLMKTLSTEMKAARQQHQDLEEAGTFLSSLSSPDRQVKPASPSMEMAAQRPVNGRSRGSRLESVSRFSEPPAPPPQQPLPEKPDVSRSSPTDASSNGFVKRTETAKASSTFNVSPTNPPSSQILSLVEALSSTKKELDSQAARVKQLEELLQEERSAREIAEERVRRLEQTTSPGSAINAEKSETPYHAASESTDASRPWPEVNGSAELTTKAAASETELQQRLEAMVAEMAEMKKEMERHQKRAEAADTAASSAKLTLAEMVTRLRKENVESAPEAEKTIDDVTAPSPSPEDISLPSTTSIPSSPMLLRHDSSRPNELVRPPSKLAEPLERALAVVLRDANGSGEMLVQTAPYASMLGVVLIGVGLMAYLNSWQKAEK